MDTGAAGLHRVCAAVFLYDSYQIFCYVPQWNMAHCAVPTADFPAHAALRPLLVHWKAFSFRLHLCKIKWSALLPHHVRVRGIKDGLLVFHLLGARSRLPCGHHTSLLKTYRPEEECPLPTYVSYTASLICLHWQY